MWNLLQINLHNLTHLWRKKNSVFRFVCGGCLEGFGGGGFFRYIFLFETTGLMKQEPSVELTCARSIRMSSWDSLVLKRSFTNETRPNCTHHNQNAPMSPLHITWFYTERGGSLRLPKKADYLHIREKARERRSTRQRTARLLTGSKEHSIAHTITSKNQFSILLVKIN